MIDHIFEGLDGEPRPAKPRTQGFTMVADWGIGLNAQEDLVQTTGAYVDFAKIAVGISRLLPNDLLQKKLAHYREHQIEPFPGGQYLEYAEIEGKFDLYFPAVAKAGYSWVEVSDNLAPVSLEWKERTIRQAVEEHGLKVLGEVGKKEGLDNDAPLADNAKACLSGGASIILLEAAELISDNPDIAQEVESVIEVVGIDKVMFELPGPWIEGVSHHQIHSMRAELLKRYGPNLNLGNVSPGDAMSLEAYRRRLGVNAGS
ncbi:MAG: phosphosulfolactate synthase [Candidatus Latescibacteria bacterium]|jgi:phosphosulfolactate synthase|nr:phosphosulfolactate synthase [Candidatus Latescibacterota bacterium]